jgi:hypothetical protein
MIGMDVELGGHRRLSHSFRAGCRLPFARLAVLHGLVFGPVWGRNPVGVGGYWGRYPG